MIDGHAHSTSLPDGSADAVVMSGVTSLMSDILPGVRRGRPAVDERWTICHRRSLVGLPRVGTVPRTYFEASKT